MKKSLFSNDFQFKMYDHDEALLDISFGMNAKDYKSVDIPHDALIHDAHSFYSDKVIWYRKKLNLLPDNNIYRYLYFEGVYMDATIYIDDQVVGHFVNGYTSFHVAITNYINNGAQYLYVCIDHRCPNSRWYSGPGITRDVWLYESSFDHFEIDSLYVCPKQKDSNNWEINVSVETNIIYAALPSDLFGPMPQIIFNCEELGISTELTPYDPDHFSSRINVNNPRLWDTKNPYVYSCFVSMSIDGKITDTIETRFGFRNILMTTDKGMFLNGEPIKLNGVCLHSDQGCLGSAFNADMARRQLTLMKEMGANAVRLAHNVQAPAFLDICDELGILVCNEAFDCWKKSKTTYDYARYFDEYSKADIERWVTRDRNHPSLLMWSAGNEIYDTHADKEGADTLMYITNEIRKHDFFEAAPVFLCSNYMAWENTINAVDNIKHAGYNYGEFLYETHHKEHPDWIIFGSETASCVQSRGIYHFPLSQSLLVDDDEHCSSLGNSATSWGAKNMDFCVTTERDTPYSLGQFLWSGIDYLGEPTPYHTKSSYFGLVDTAGFPKDVYYMLQSCYRSFEDKPVIHILPYWDFNNGQLIDVRICSNAYEVELFFNDASLGRKRIDHNKDMIMYADYQLPYEKGVLKAVGYSKDGSAVIQTSESSFGDTASLNLSVSHFTCEENDTTLRFVEITALDADGNPVRNASDRVEITIDGPARLIGLCNGDQTDYDSFKGTSMRLFSGKLLAVVKPEGAGEVNVNATISTADIPVRKLEIVADNKTKLSPDNNIVKAAINICPANASYKEIEYQITNESGVPIRNAVVEKISENEIQVKAVADAIFNLRALCHECDGRVTVISSIGFEATGFGELVKDPYSFISGSLYDDFKSELGNGNEKGVATSRTEDSYLLYKDIDFGTTGSNKITVPIFELGGEPVGISFWSGMPHGETSVLLGSFVYHKPSIWNVYQPETFTLNQVLTGMHDLGIEVNKQKIHIKGFEFEELNTTYDLHLTKDADDIYGDQFTISDDMVKNIGNNVCIVYKNMDFGSTGATKIHITGHTPLPQNTVHIRFNDGQNENRQIIEFKQSDNIETQSFELSPICGKGELSFVFLPGSDFDFKDFLFESPLHH